MTLVVEVEVEVAAAVVVFRYRHQVEMPMRRLRSMVGLHPLLSWTTRVARQATPHSRRWKLTVRLGLVRTAYRRFEATRASTRTHRLRAICRVRVDLAGRRRLYFYTTHLVRRPKARLNTNATRRIIVARRRLRRLGGLRRGDRRVRVGWVWV